MKVLDAIALIVVVIGGLNWGLVGLFEFNLVDSLFGEGSALARAVYIIVGIAAIYALISYFMKMSAESGGTSMGRR